MTRVENGNKKPTGADELPVYTFAEIAKHNTPESSWCVVRGRVLDLTKFLKKHPGGSQIILASGIDATILVDSYHPNGVPSAIIDKLTIGCVAKSVSYYEMDDRPEAFYPTLKRRVHERLRQLNVSRRGSMEIQLKAMVIFSTLFISYVCGWLLPDLSLWTRVAFAILHGIAAAHVGMSVMHDANHAAFSKSSRVNSVLGATLDLIGASGCVWSFQHVVSHHAFTNLETRTERNLEAHRNLKSGKEDNKTDVDLQLSHENDVDVFSSYPMMRMHPADPRFWYHRYQHLYGPILFGLFTLVKIFYSDMQFYLAGRVAHVDMAPRMVRWREHIVFLGLKAFNFSVMILVPLYLHGWPVTCVLLLVAHFVAGEYLAICFIVSHISEAALFYQGGHQIGLPDADLPQSENNQGRKVHPRDWAALQATSTVNWAAESWFWGAFSGGLNTQFEHHVFPGVNHTAYRFMPPVIREVCKEFNVPYTEVPTLYDAIVLCMRYLRALGMTDSPTTGTTYSK